MAQQTDLGTVQIRNEVVGTIAALAAQEVQGVVGIWRGIFPFSFWGGKSGVYVQIQDQEVRVALSLIVEYGVSLPHVAMQVQDRVREMIERMTHLSAAEVHVSIHHVKPKRSDHR
ncbi:MAG: Asp23/Gls24 family envelope stress response protein [Candidatus Omnitrophica bacterium]|nr:Asp23/Gls24 family envelope stress response protein [Candidatus Omnitrophota bacterium]